MRISTLKDIDKLLTNNELKKHLKVIGLVFDTSLNLDYCLKNNNSRNRIVPIDVIKKQQKLFINNICEIENKALNYHREKLLITSISFGSGDGQMSLKLCNTKDLPVI